MKTYAIIIDNKIWNLVVAENESVVDTVLASINQPYDKIVEMTEATGSGGVGDEYYQERFRRPKPSDAYEWHEASFTWKPIEPAPTDGTYFWNEATETWQKLK